MASNNTSRREDKSITEIVRDCVREELNLQRSGSNSSLLLRTRNLISNSARSASVQIGNSLTTNGSNPPTNSASSSTSRQTSQHSSQIFRPANTTTAPGHPWRFKKGKQKMPKQQEFTPKAIHLLDMYTPPCDSDEEPGCSNQFVPDYTLKDEDVLLKGYFELGNAQSEVEIRESICEVLRQRFPLIECQHFDFVKRDRNKIITPVVNKSMTWDFKHIKELCGQGKLYVRLNVRQESLQILSVNEVSSDDEDTKSDEELMQGSVISAKPAKRVCSGTSVVESNTGTPTEQATPISAFSNRRDTSTKLPTASSTASNNASGVSDKERLRELVPYATEKQLDKALAENYTLSGAANALFQDTAGSSSDIPGEKLSSSDDEEDLTMATVTKKLSKKLSGNHIYVTLMIHIF